MWHVLYDRKREIWKEKRTRERTIAKWILFIHRSDWLWILQFRWQYLWKCPWQLTVQSEVQFYRWSHWLAKNYLSSPTEKSHWTSLLLTLSPKALTSVQGGGFISISCLFSFFLFLFFFSSEKIYHYRLVLFLPLYLISYLLLQWETQKLISDIFLWNSQLFLFTLHIILWEISH